ncbi:MAG: crossover junction endodeoxyribonuclease RuvC, partial [Oscillospiraceae bacterium]|nr:crossover junction endodeoxyribonuclease RuvC [Oscillospiraceae bacterium]
MKILGIDPGIATIGFAVLSADKNDYKLINCGVIETPAHMKLSVRLAQIYSDLNQLIEHYKPDCVSIEEL